MSGRFEVQVRIFEKRRLVVGFETAYSVSNLGGVKSLSRTVVGSNGFVYHLRYHKSEDL
jgi:hypothetical protein